MVVLIILFIILIIACSYFIIVRRPVNDRAEVTTIHQTYNSSDGDFVISGEKDEFTITKNNSISFLVKDGQIVACMDKRASNEFKYYEDK